MLSLLASVSEADLWATLVRLLDPLFGRGDDGFPLWLLAVRLNVVVFVGASLWLLVASIADRSTKRIGVTFVLVSTATILVGLCQFLCVQRNLGDLGGIGYSRLLLGYRGHFGLAQLYSLVFARTARTLEVGISLNRLAATLSIPVLWVACSRLAPGRRLFPAAVLLVFSLAPLHLLFASTDVLPIGTSFVGAVALLLLLQATSGEAVSPATRWLRAIAAGAAWALLTQIRQENILFLLPAGILVLRRRHFVGWPEFVGGILLVLFAVVYLGEAVRAGTPFQNPIRARVALEEGLQEFFSNPVYGIFPTWIATGLVVVLWRDPLRFLAPLPLLVGMVMSAVTNTWSHDMARTFLNSHLAVSFIAGFGITLLARVRLVGLPLAVGLLVWFVSLPVGFAGNLSDRYLETVEHELFDQAIRAVPAGTTRIIVPDDLGLEHSAHSTIEMMNKFRMVAAGAGMRGIELVGASQFLESPDEARCANLNCAVFLGALCVDLPQHWYAKEECEWLRLHLGDALIEQGLTVGSMQDCSVKRQPERAPDCNLSRARDRVGLYRFKG